MSSQPTKPLTVAELLTDLSSLKACTPAEATALISTTSSTHRSSSESEDNHDADLNSAKELIALFNEVAERAGVDELAQVRESVRRIEESVQGRVE